MPKLLVALAFTVLAVSACSAGQSGTTAADAKTLAATPAPAGTVTPAVRKTIAATLTGIQPGVKVQVIAPTPIDGLYQVVVAGQVLYMSGDGRFLFQGDAFDTVSHTELNTATMNRLRREAIAKLQPAQMIRFAPPDPKYTITVFTDVDCPYCKAFHSHMAEINKLGIAVNYLFWPRTGLGTPSAQKAVNVWCASDRQAALTNAFLGGQLTDAHCQSPVARDFHLGIDLGVEGTPAVFAENGALLGGYIAPKELLHRLESTRSSTR